MNIESIQTGSPPQRTTTPDTSVPMVRKEKPISSQQTPALQNTQAEDQRNTEKPQLSVEDAVKHLTDFVAPTNANISFTIDQESGIHVVKVLDSQTKEVIRQFPSEEAVRIAQALDKLQGLFVKDKA